MKPLNSQNLRTARPPCCNHRGAGRHQRLHAFCCAFTLIELLVVIGIIGVLAGLLFPTFSRVKAGAHSAACTSQLRQLGIATRLYAEDNNSLLPSAEILPSMPVDAAKPQPRICDVLAPYVGRRDPATNASAAVFKCPADTVGRFAREGSSYEWNTELNGHRIDETLSVNIKFGVAVGDPGGFWLTNGIIELRFPPLTTPLLLNYDEFHPRRPPKTGKNVVFMDNHVTPLELVPPN